MNYSITVILYVLKLKTCIRQVYTALKNETRNENQLQVLRDIETNLPQMNEIRQKSYEIAKMKPKEVDKSGKLIDVKLKPFEMPHHEKSFIGYGFVEALFKVMKQVDYTSMPSQSNQQTMKKVYDDWKSFFEASKKYSKYMSIIRNGKDPKEGMFNTKRMISLDRKRNNRVMDFLHKASAKVVGIALVRNIDTIIIGRNVGWKLEVDMQKANKQTFIQIPHSTFIEMIRYKAERKGVQVIDREESFTSKSSFLNHDPIPTFGEEHQTIFSGYRSTRAFYKIKGSKVLIHADVNGAFNIVRKHVKNAFEGLERKQFLQSPQKIIINSTHAKLKASA
jgi:IS605 OrfB family transposase